MQAAGGLVARRLTQPYARGAPEFGPPPAATPPTDTAGLPGHPSIDCGGGLSGGAGGGSGNGPAPGTMSALLGNGGVCPAVGGTSFEQLAAMRVAARASMTRIMTFPSACRFAHWITHRRRLSPWLRARRATSYWRHRRHLGIAARRRFCRSCSSHDFPFMAWQPGSPPAAPHFRQKPGAGYHPSDFDH